MKRSLEEYRELEEKGLLLVLSEPLEEDVVKAIKCIASTEKTGYCYADEYNIKQKHDEDYITMICGDAEGFQPCPYCQDKYDVCFEDGECKDWIKKLIKILQV